MDFSTWSMGGTTPKYQLLRPKKFLWEDKLMGGIAGAITSGTGDQIRFNWKVLLLSHQIGLPLHSGCRSVPKSNQIKNQELSSREGADLAW